ncbi:MAG: crotonobetainyl-CoA:carnitine CoA-transferase CaiB-like acyl-CoA transferase [Paracoccaceae bacterium]|jgi:crotonobetainyl-CoA:carnitine CoA-transferase CaiB-like acyl-CoA transferase
MEAEDVPCAQALALEELPDDPQIPANQSLVSYTHPVSGELREPRAAARFVASEFETPLPAAALGKHSDEILEGIGLGEGNRIPAINSHCCLRYDNI